MIKKFITFVFMLLVVACSNVEFVLKESNEVNPLKDKTLLLMDKSSNERFVRALYSYFGKNEKYEYILQTNFLENKENRVVKNNQVAEKIEYNLKINYILFYKTSECVIFNKTIISKFSFTPKSSGYNFGSDRSFDRLYTNSVDQNINNFINALQINKSCLE